jgi:transketolase
LKHLARTANQLRGDAVRMVHLAVAGHPGPSLSIADIVTVLCFHVMRIDLRRGLDYSSTLFHTQLGPL